MGRLQNKSIDAPDEVRAFPNGRVEITSLDEFVVNHATFEPGWRWSNDVKPIARTDLCQSRHLGVIVRGHLHVRLEDGTEMVLGPGPFEMPPGHDAWVEGQEPWESYEFASGRTYARPPEIDERRLVAVLFTDIVDSTRQLAVHGDRRWRDILLEHNSRVRAQLDRFRGREIATTGDGFVATFDSTLRAIQCARGLAAAVADLGIEIRAGVHTGEVEFIGDNVRGVAVHLAARIMAIAGPTQVAVSATTMQLAAGTELAFESLGLHELKGIAGSQEVFRVATLAAV